MNDLQTIISAISGMAGMNRPSGLSPWAIREDAIAASMQTVRALRSREAVPMTAAGAFPVGRRGDRIDPSSFATRVGSIGIVPVIGPLMARMSYGAWSYDEIVRDLRIMASKPDISAVILDVDSPGGMVANVECVPIEIARLRTIKPVYAHIGGMGASAGYWVPSAAEKVFADKTALVGSVGALIRYVDMEGILTRLGANVVEIIAEQSPNKRLARDSEEGRAELQAITDDAAELFLEGLARNRGISREEIIEGYGQGLVFAAGEALSRRMIDGICSFEDVLTSLADRHSTSLIAASATANAENHKETTVELTLEKLKAEHPDLVSAIAKEATEQATSIAAKSERERLLGIEEQAAGLSGHDELVKKLKMDGKSTPAEAALQLLAAEKAKLAEMRAGLAALDNAAAGVESRSSGGEGSQTVAQTPEGWKSEWEASAKLQEEYPTADAYVATMKRKAA